MILNMVAKLGYILSSGYWVTGDSDQLYFPDQACLIMEIGYFLQYLVINMLMNIYFNEHDSVPNMVLQTPPAEVLSHVRADARAAKLHPLRRRAKTVQVLTRTSTASQVLLRTVTAATGSNPRTGTTGSNPRTGDRWCGTDPTCKDCSGTTRTRAACHCEETQELRRDLLRYSALREET